MPSPGESATRFADTADDRDLPPVLSPSVSNYTKWPRLTQTAASASWTLGCGKNRHDAPDILDRFLHHAGPITITGKSHRLRNKTAKESARKAEAPTAEPCTDPTT